MGDITKAAYVSRNNDLLSERDQLEAQPAAASLALQRERTSEFFTRIDTAFETKRASEKRPN